MTKKTFSFSTARVTYYFGATIAYLPKLVSPDLGIIITDTHVYAKHKRSFAAYKTVVIPAGEANKTITTVEYITNELIKLGADRNTFLIGIGGGVVTDITGFVAGVFMRGVAFGFIPTSILAMVDASIGGKNGVDTGLYKNMIGITRQPSFLLLDYTLLKTLPKAEWVNGFAEIIKHACIKDSTLFSFLQQHRIADFQKNDLLIAQLIQKNILLKTRVVQHDEFEQGERKLLNFGHTIGHAIENLYQIPHGHAISIGMGVACKLSEEITGFRQTKEVLQVLKQYGLPPQFEFDRKQTFKILQSDKKRQGTSINYILLTKVGKAVISNLPMNRLEEMIMNL